jgi:hypothetical protein
MTPFKKEGTHTILKLLYNKKTQTRAFSSFKCIWNCKNPPFRTIAQIRFACIFDIQHVYLLLYASQFYKE